MAEEVRERENEGAHAECVLLFAPPEYVDKFRLELLNEYKNEQLPWQRSMCLHRRLRCRTSQDTEEEN